MLNEKEIKINNEKYGQCDECGAWLVEEYSGCFDEKGNTIGEKTCPQCNHVASLEADLYNIQNDIKSAKYEAFGKLVGLIATKNYIKIIDICRQDLSLNDIVNDLEKFFKKIRDNV